MSSADFHALQDLGDPHILVVNHEETLHLCVMDQALLWGPSFCEVWAFDPEVWNTISLLAHET